MKLRTGFVSNSSSSSFVLVISKKDHEEALKQMPAAAEKLFDYLDCSEGKIGDVELVLFGEWSDAGGSGTWNYIDEDLGGLEEGEIEGAEDWYEVWEQYQKLVKGKAVSISLGG